DLRRGDFDVLVGINLLREGLDIPEVSLVAILDADKEGFLRSETSLIQTCGRAARNAEGRVIMYADKLTKAINQTIAITERRRKMQEEYNTLHGIVPKTVRREIAPLVEASPTEEPAYGYNGSLERQVAEGPSEYLTEAELLEKIQFYEAEM